MGSVNSIPGNSVLGPNGWVADPVERDRVYVDRETGALVLPDGNPVGLAVPRIERLAGIVESIFAQDSRGRYWLTQHDAVNGVYSDQLALGVGDPLTGLTKTPLTNTRGANLLSSTGGALAFVGPAHVWPLPDGGAIYAGAGPSSRWYLYKITAAGTVGANSPAFDNKRAVLDIGSRSGTHTPLITSLHSRSLCVATIAGQTVLLFGEYNVAASRTPGGANDHVRVWKSTDLGATWSVLLEWNTGGVHQVRHVHAVVQDPDTGLIYICCGDDPNAGIIRWDGVSTAPAANSNYVAIAATPGWDVLYDSTNKFRICDIVFADGGAHYLRDSSLPADTPIQSLTRTGLFAAISRASLPADELVIGRDPVMGVAVPGGGWLFFGMWVVPTSTRTYDVWSSAGAGRARKIAEIPDVGAAGTGVLANVFFDKLGNLIVCSCKPRGAELVTGANGGSLVYKV